MSQSSFPHTQSWMVQFSALPENLEELKLLPEAGLLQPYHTAALTVAALCAYVKNPAAAILMLDYLKGPQPMSTYDKQFLADRLRGKDYLPNSFFSGAVPESGYLPVRPLTLIIMETVHSAAQLSEGYMQLYIQSGGADSPRPVKLRQKPSTGQWFLWEQMLLSDIRQPVSCDSWA